jgi:hypothetical protein
VDDIGPKLKECKKFQEFVEELNDFIIIIKDGRGKN